MTVDAKFVYFSHYLRRFIINQPQVFICIRLLVTVYRYRQRFSRLSLSLKNGFYLLGSIMSVPVIKNVHKSKQFIFRLEGIHIIVNSDIADIIIGKYGLYQYSTADLFKLIERKLGIGGFILGFGLCVIYIEPSFRLGEDCN